MSQLHSPASSPNSPAPETASPLSHLDGSHTIQRSPSRRSNRYSSAGGQGGVSQDGSRNFDSTSLFAQPPTPRYKDMGFTDILELAVRANMVGDVPDTGNASSPEPSSPETGSPRGEHTPSKSHSKRKPSRREVELDNKLKKSENKVKDLDKKNKDLQKKVKGYQKDIGVLRNERDTLIKEKAASDLATSTALKERQLDHLAFQKVVKHKEELLKKLLWCKREVIAEQQKAAEAEAERAFLATIKKGSLQDKALAMGTLTYNVGPLPTSNRPGTAPNSRSGSHSRPGRTASGNVRFPEGDGGERGDGEANNNNLLFKPGSASVSSAFPTTRPMSASSTAPNIFRTPSKPKNVPPTKMKLSETIPGQGHDDDIVSLIGSAGGGSAASSTSLSGTMRGTPAKALRGVQTKAQQAE